MKKIGIGLIGAGWISSYHIKGYQSLADKVEVIGVADVNEKNCKKIAKESGTKYTFSNYKELLKLAEVDAVDITTPTPFHAEMAIGAANSGKHVLCEKPFALNVNECEQMINAAKRNHILLMPGHNRVFFPPHLKASEFLANGRIGEPKIMQSNFIEGIALSDFLRTNWRGNKKTGGFTHFAISVALAYMAERFMGKTNTVSAHVTNLIERKFDVETSAMIILEFESGGLGTLTLSWESGFGDDTELIIGTKGTILINGVEWQSLRRPPLGIYTNEIKSWEFPNVAFDWDQSFINMIKHFIGCIQNNKEPMVSAQDGRNAIAVVQAIYKSAREKRNVKVE